MEISLGKELNQEIFEELFKDKRLGLLTLEEIIDIAMNGEGMNSKCGLWTFAGAYYQNGVMGPKVIIDREFNCEYNNSELEIEENSEGDLISNDKTFVSLINSQIRAKEENKCL